MGRYPFIEKAEELMDARKGFISDLSWDVQNRRYKRMSREFIALKDEGEVSTTSPAKFTAEDIRVFLAFRKSKGVGSSDLRHDISALRQLTQFCGNGAVDECLIKFQGTRPARKSTRLEPLSNGTYRAIRMVWDEVDVTDFMSVRAVAMVLLYIGTGARNKELRLATVGDVDTDAMTIRFVHVKGEDSYGEPRVVPIPYELQDVLLAYLMARDEWLKSNNRKTSALFFSTIGECDFLSGNSIRKIKSKVEKMVGDRFELRDCRRAFGQKYIDKGLGVDKVSILMGHDSTKTTEQYYCRMKEDAAIADARKLW